MQCSPAVEVCPW